MIIQVSIYERGRSFLRSNTLVIYFLTMPCVHIWDNYTFKEKYH